MTKIVFIGLVLLANVASAVDCPASKVVNIQVHPHSILFKLQNQNWHRLGIPGEQGVAEMYSALLAAQMSGKRVVVRYPGEYDCAAYETETDPQMIRIYND